MQPKNVMVHLPFLRDFNVQREKKMKSIEESNYTLAKQICTMRNGWHKPLEGKQR